MCKRKDNLDKIKGFQQSLNFRLDYYAVPQSLRSLVDELYQGGVYEERKPTEEEMQVIDYDNVATCMNTTITELLYHNCHIISGLEDGNCTLYIHKNFISIQYETQSSDDNAKVCDFVKHVFSKIDGNDRFNVQDLYCKVLFAALDVDKTDVWNQFDKTAFPVMEEVSMINGSYVDSHQCAPYFIDLFRNINPNSEGKYDVIVSTTALCDDSLGEIREKGLGAHIDGILEESLSEITRCFTD